MPINWSGFKWIAIKELSPVSYAERIFNLWDHTHAEFFSLGRGGLDRFRQRHLGFCSGSGCVSSSQIGDFCVCVREGSHL